MVREVLEQGRRHGELRTDIDAELQMDVLYAPIYERLVMGHLPLDRHFAQTLSQAVLGLLTVQPAAKPETKRRASKNSEKEIVIR